MIKYSFNDLRKNQILRVHASGKNCVKNSANGQKCNIHKRDVETVYSAAGDFLKFPSETVWERTYSIFLNNPMKKLAVKFHRPAKRFSRPANSIFFESLGRRNSPFAGPK